MPEIKCPECGAVFSVDETSYASIVKQVRDREFEQELTARQTAAVKLVASEKDREIAELTARVRAFETEKAAPIGIVLCVLAVIPLGISLLFSEEDGFLHVISVGIMLILIAFGVLLIVRTSIVWGGFRILLEEGDYTREAKEDQKAHSSIGTIYWLAVTAIFLGWSFFTNSWDRTWIIWPVAGVAYGAAFAIAKALRKKND